MGSTELRPRIVPIFSFSDNPNLLIKLYMVSLLCRNSNYVKLSAGYLSAGCMWLTSKISLLRVSTNDVRRRLEAGEVALLDKLDTPPGPPSMEDVDRAKVRLC